MSWLESVTRGGEYSTQSFSERELETTRFAQSLTTGFARVSLRVGILVQIPLGFAKVPGRVSQGVIDVRVPRVHSRAIS